MLCRGCKDGNCQTCPLHLRQMEDLQAMRATRQVMAGEMPTLLVGTNTSETDKEWWQVYMTTKCWN